MYIQKLSKYIIQFISFFIFLFSINSISSAHSAEVITSPAQFGVQQLINEPTGISFTYNAPPIVQQNDGTIHAGDLPQLRQSGAPILPFYSSYIVLPAEANAQLTVNAIEQRQQQIDEPAYHPYPAGAVVDLDGSVLPASADLLIDGGIRVEYRKDPAVYEQDNFFPTQLYTLSEPTYFRDIRLIQLTLYPYRYNPQTQQLETVQQLDVEIQFTGADFSNMRPLNIGAMDYKALLGDRILNPEQIDQWRSLPASMQGNGTALPIGQDTYKIEVNEDGIYDITGQDLANAGMNISSVNPHNIQMLHNGNPVAYQFVGDGDNSLEPTEIIRFYGWKFDGSRLDKQYFTNNIYWLWANGNATTIGSQANNNSFTQATSYRSSVTAEPENYWFSTWIGNWEDMPNEPDAWFWDYMTRNNIKQYSVNTPNPVPANANATFVAEFTTRTLTPNEYKIDITVNNDPTITSGFWVGKKNVNISSTTPTTVLTDTTLFTTHVVSATGRIYFNRITVEYDSQLKAVNDQLKFEYSTNNRRFEISNFTTDSAFVWDVTNKLQPVNITLQAGDVVNSGGNYTYKFGSATAGTFLATNLANIKTPIAISQYTPVDLNPSGANNVDWLAITHVNFFSQAQRLANHRANQNYGDYQTHVIDIHHIIQQYGYGFPTPAAYHNFFNYILASWNTPPTYVTLFGDSTINPRQIDCLAFCPSGNDFNNHETNFVPTANKFVDRFQGLVPSDTDLVLVNGTGDLIPDFAIGRIPGQTLSEIRNGVDKIIRYDENARTPTAWQETITLVSDANDGTGNFFCNESHQMENLLPAGFDIKVDEFCLPDNLPDPPVQADIDQLRINIFNATQLGTSILNYRGHGGVQTWGEGGSEIITVDDATWWQNPEPFVLVSADCLDGYFASPGFPGIAESFLKVDTIGTAGHWSSTGLGFTYEHTVLEEAFFAGIFDEGYTAFGSAALYAKLQYLPSTLPSGPNHNSLIYTFNLLGDPAMEIYRPELEFEKIAQQTTAIPGSNISFNLEVTNNGILPIRPIITDTLPAGTTYVNATSAENINVTVNGNQIVIEFQDYLYWNETVHATLVAQVNPDFSGSQIVNTAISNSHGLDITSGNETDSASVTIDTQVSVYLPFVHK